MRNKMAKCDICKEEHTEATQSCSACNKVVRKYQNKTKYPMEEVRAALKNAYMGTDNNESCFRCEYTGIIGKFNSKNGTVGTYKDAFILTLDHKNPPGEKLAVSLNIINKMKGDIPSDIFKKVVIALGEYFKNESEESSQELEEYLRQIIK
jgi:hypothetical protein